MDPKAAEALRQLIASGTTAALGTLHEGAPSVSMVLYVPAPGASGFLIHVSRLAQHTRDMLADPRVGLMVAAQPGETQNPQALARLSVRGTARELATPSGEAELAAQTYLARFPKARLTLGLGDFSFFEIRPVAARFVGGFAQAFDVSAEALRQALAAAPAAPNPPRSRAGEAPQREEEP
jgi:putative heme iron utilization protein